MIQPLLLTAWALSGVGTAAVLTPEPGNRLAWAPIAIVLGPLWAAVASEQLTPRPDPGPVPHRPPTASTTPNPARV